MARTKISEFSATPGNNTDIDGINIAEGCAPSGINDAIRELMSQLKDFQAGTAGDSFNGPVGTTTAAAGAFTTLSASSTVSGTGFSTYLASPPAIGGTTAAAGSFTTLSASGNVTLSGGTANGVAYLNGSKVLTTGSGLVYDGSSLTLGSATKQLGTTNNFWANSPTAANGGIGLSPDSKGAGSHSVVSYIGGSTFTQLNLEGSQIGFYLGTTGLSSEQMRLTSTGLGIGTSSPAGKLDVTGSLGKVTVDSSGTVLSLTYGANNYLRASSASGVLNIGAYDYLTFQTGSGFSDRMRLDSSGNLGLGVTPSAWSSSFKALNIAANGQSVSADGSQIIIGSNYVQESGGARYVTSAAAGYYAVSRNSHVWATAPSGTAGNAISFTQAMTLDADGDLGIGTTSPSEKLDVYVNSTANISAKVGNTSGSIQLLQSNGIAYLYTAANQPIAFSTNNTERARIDSSGNLLVGTTSTGGRLVLGVVPSGTGIVQRWSATGGTAEYFEVNSTNVGSITCSTTTTAYVTSSDYRLKENIQPMTGALAKVAALKPCTYKWKADGSDGEGFIAHELQAVVPQCVTGEKDAVDEEGKPVYQGIDTSFLVATLTAAIQELKAEFDAYKATHP